jgi:hypothetical protein
MHTTQTRHHRRAGHSVQAVRMHTTQTRHHRRAGHSVRAVRMHTTQTRHHRRAGHSVQAVRMHTTPHFQKNLVSPPVSACIPAERLFCCFWGSGIIYATMRARCGMIRATIRAGRSAARRTSSLRPLSCACVPSLPASGDDSRSVIFFFRSLTVWGAGREGSGVSSGIARQGHTLASQSITAQHWYSRCAVALQWLVANRSHINGASCKRRMGIG